MQVRAALSGVLSGHNFSLCWPRATRRARNADRPDARSQRRRLHGDRRQRCDWCQEQRAVCAVRSRLPVRHRLRVSAEATSASRRKDRHAHQPRRARRRAVADDSTAHARDRPQRRHRELHRANGAVRADEHDAHHDFCGRERRQCHRAGDSGRRWAATRRTISARISIVKCSSGAWTSRISSAGSGRGRPTPASSR